MLVEAATKLDLVMRQLVDAQQELKTHQSSLNLLKQSILRNEIQVIHKQPVSLLAVYIDGCLRASLTTLT